MHERGCSTRRPAVFGCVSSAVGTRDRNENEVVTDEGVLNVTEHLQASSKSVKFEE
jgi:hypothetical protein